jgi:hypothetical protein
MLEISTSGLMSEDGKRSGLFRAQPPRPSSTLLVRAGRMVTSHRGCFAPRRYPMAQAGSVPIPNHAPNPDAHAKESTTKPGQVRIKPTDRTATSSFSSVLPLRSSIGAGLGPIPGTALDAAPELLACSIFCFSGGWRPHSVPRRFATILAKVGEQASRGRPHQPLFGLPLALGVQSGEKFHLAGRQSRNRNTVSVNQTIVGQCSQPWAGREESD